MTKKIFAVLAVVAALGYAVDIALEISHTGPRPAMLFKVFLAGCFALYGYRVFHMKRVDARAPTPPDAGQGG